MSQVLTATLGLLEFIPTVVILSTSGVLSPGPLIIASISRAVQSEGKSGIECAVGHTLVELPLVIGLAIGSLIWLRDNPVVVRAIGLAGGIVLLFFATLQAQEARLHVGGSFAKLSKARYADQPGVLLGIVFTALNPFFILWWVSVGVQLLELAFSFGAIAGVAIMYRAHIWMDYAWLGGVGVVASRKRFSFGKWYRILLVGFALAMAYFGIMFIISSIL